MKLIDSDIRACAFRRVSTMESTMKLQVMISTVSKMLLKGSHGATSRASCAEWETVRSEKVLFGAVKVPERLMITAVHLSCSCRDAGKFSLLQGRTFLENWQRIYFWKCPWNKQKVHSTLTRRKNSSNHQSKTESNGFIRWTDRTYYIWMKVWMNEDTHSLFDPLHVLLEVADDGCRELLSLLQQRNWQF